VHTIALSLLLLASLGAPTEWTRYQYAATNNAVFPGPLLTEWSFDTGGKINGGLAIVGDTLYVTSFSRKVFALDVNTGERRWSASFSNILMTTPIVADGLVFVGTGNNDTLFRDGHIICARPEGDEVVALRARDGARVWSFRTVGEDMPTPELLNHRLIFSNGDAHAYALDEMSGREQWSVPMPGFTTMASTALAGGNVILQAFHDAKTRVSQGPDHVLALDPQTGRVMWSAIHGNADCSPTVVASTVLCENSDEAMFPRGRVSFFGTNTVTAYDANTGAETWHWTGDPGYFTDVGSYEYSIAAVADSGVLFQSVPTASEVVALRIRDGSLLWSFRTAAPVKMSGIVFSHYLIFGDTAGLLYAVDTQTGMVNNAIAFETPFATSSPVLVGKTLFIANGSSVLAIPLSRIIE
jgi:outer membrane protein assembly factor BamB